MELNDLLVRFEREGPVELQLTEEEYIFVKNKVRLYWPNRNRRYEETAWKMLLMCLRGYTFYRKISEHEDRFWSNFHSELGLPENTQPNYKYLKAALSWHPLTKDQIITSGVVGHQHTEYVSTIDQIWGFRGLYVSELRKLFSDYYQLRSTGQVSDTLFHQGPSQGQGTKRSLVGYKHVMAALAEVVDFLVKDPPWDLLQDPTALSDWLEESGLVLGEPNPILFVYNKSDQVLTNILEELTPTLQIRIGEPGRSEEELGEDQEEARDNTITNRFIKVRWLVKKRNLWPKVDPLAGRAYSGKYPLEGLQECGQLLLADGRYQSFSWKPRLGQAVEQQITFEEGEVFRFTLETKCLAVRIQDAKSGEFLQELACLDPANLLLWAHFPLDQPLALRCSLRSKPAQRYILDLEIPRYDTWLGHMFAITAPQAFAKLNPVVDDVLLIEVCTHKNTENWAPLLRFPVRVPPALSVLGVERNQLQLRLAGPQGMKLAVEEQPGYDSGYTLSQTITVNAGEFVLKLKHPPRWRAKSVRLTLRAGSLWCSQTLELAPQEQPSGWLASGLGYSPLSKR